MKKRILSLFNYFNAATGRKTIRLASGHVLCHRLPPALSGGVDFGAGHFYAGSVLLNIVLVHGAFHGGWCWSEVAAELSRRGARVHTPTLTGLADRQHLFSPSVNLATHVKDIVNLIEYEKLDDCVLVGHSYAGNVLSGVGDQLRERVGHYIFVDASVPVNGSTHWGWAHLNPESTPDMMELLNTEGRGMMIPPFPAAAFGITDPAQAKALEAQLTPMPRGCFTDAIELKNCGTEGLRRSYIAATNPPYARMARTVAWVSADPQWTFREIDSAHDMMILKPLETAEIIWALADGGQRTEDRGQRTEVVGCEFGTVVWIGRLTWCGTLEYL
ncbi:hypothetical protein AB833_13540 [Chromatiales bacterium (ex Bugula neritina AB1)]|nr:hypothetical protein AB833_13540 [Chromatiales bacterium (ex Bugula neritina AB1)]